jgi:hypothetical protein
VFRLGILENGFDDDVRAGHASTLDVGGQARHELGRLAGILEALGE